MYIVNKILDYVEVISNSLRVPAYLCLIGIVGVMNYEVAARYLFRNPTGFAFDIAVSFGILMVAFSVSFILREEGHISITLVSERLTPKADYCLIVVSSIFGTGATCEEVTNGRNTLFLLSAVGS